MRIRKDGIFRNIDSKDYGIWQKSGWEKVVVDVEPKKVKAPKPEPIVEELKVEEEKPIEEVVEPDQPFQDEEQPKPKKKKKV